MDAVASAEDARMSRARSGLFDLLARRRRAACLPGAGAESPGAERAGADEPGKARRRACIFPGHPMDDYRDTAPGHECGAASAQILESFSEHTANLSGRAGCEHCRASSRTVKMKTTQNQFHDGVCDAGGRHRLDGASDVFQCAGPIRHRCSMRTSAVVISRAHFRPRRQRPADGGKPRRQLSEFDAKSEARQQAARSRCAGADAVSQNCPHGRRRAAIRLSRF